MSQAVEVFKSLKDLAAHKRGKKSEKINNQMQVLFYLKNTCSNVDLGGELFQLLIDWNNRVISQNPENRINKTRTFFIEKLLNFFLIQDDFQEKQDCLVSLSSHFFDILIHATRAGDPRAADTSARARW